MVRQSPNSFGYVELIYAVQNKMSYGSVKNASGKFVKASTDSVTAAAAGAAKNMPADYRISITNAPGADTYPISSFTWLLIPTHSTDPNKAKALADFLGWMLDHGEAEAAALTYAPLPQARSGHGPQELSQPSSSSVLPHGFAIFQIRAALFSSRLEERLARYNRPEDQTDRKIGLCPLLV